MDNLKKTEQNSEMTSGSLHDVPLSNDDPETEETTQGPIEKIPSKNGSLKRFFKLTSSKKGSNDGAKNTETDAGMDADIEDDTESEKRAAILKLANEKNKEDGSTDPNASEQTAGKTQGLGRVRSRRFNFRFGNNTAEGDTPTSSSNAPSTSRHSLRSSLSTYFSSVFKRKQNANSKHTLRTAQKNQNEQEQGGNGNENENGIEMVEQKLAAPAPEEEKNFGIKQMPIAPTEGAQLPNLSAPEEIQPTATPTEAQIQN